MKTMFKKFAAILMAAVLLLCAIPFTASAYSGQCGPNVTYSFDESTGVLTISGTGGMYTWSDHNEVPWSSYLASIKKIIINYGVTHIGDYGFCGDEGNQYYAKVESVSIPDSVTSIGERAFEHCEDLKSITIPNSVKSIGMGAFSGCGSLTDITIPDSVVTIGDGAFSFCENLTNVTIGNNVKSIGEQAFFVCQNLKNVSLGKSVKTIDLFAFAGCGIQKFSVNEGNQYFSTDSNGVLFNKDKTALLQYTFGSSSKSYNIPDGVKIIEIGALMGSQNLTSITIPVSVATIEQGAFAECEVLKDVYYKGTQVQWNKISIDNTEDANNSLLNANIHYSSTPTTDVPQTEPATSVPQTKPVIEPITDPGSNNIIKDEIRTENGVLYWEINLDDGSFKIWGEGKMPDWNSVDEVPWYDYADIVISVEIGDGVKNIGSYAFADFIKITIVIIPQGATSVGENAFCDCKKLESVVVPQSVEKIEAGAFDGCDSLEEVKYEGSQEDWEKIEVDAEGNSALEKAKIKLNYNYEDSNNNTKIIVIVAIVVVVAALVTVLMVIAKKNKKKAEVIK